MHVCDKKMNEGTKHFMLIVVKIKLVIWIYQIFSVSLHCNSKIELQG